MPSDWVVGATAVGTIKGNLQSFTGYARHPLPRRPRAAAFAY
ncbi:hypothetical protein [Oceanimonas marisflavi]|nr:hypothetical protein [Oceanimonas marisflavi]